MLYVDPGTEWALPYARKALERLRAQAKDSHLDNMSRRLDMGSGVTVDLQVTEFQDRIRITGNVGVGGAYYPGTYADPITYNNAPLVTYDRLVDSARLPPALPLWESMEATHADVVQPLFGYGVTLAYRSASYSYRLEWGAPYYYFWYGIMNATGNQNAAAYLIYNTQAPIGSFKVGDVVTISGQTPGGYNGTFSIIWVGPAIDSWGWELPEYSAFSVVNPGGADPGVWNPDGTTYVPYIDIPAGSWQNYMPVGTINASPVTLTITQRVNFTNVNTGFEKYSTSITGTMTAVLGADSPPGGISSWTFDNYPVPPEDGPHLQPGGFSYGADLLLASAGNVVLNGNTGTLLAGGSTITSTRVELTPEYAAAVGPGLDPLDDWNTVLAQIKAGEQPGYFSNILPYMLEGYTAVVTFFGAPGKGGFAPLDTAEHIVYPSGYWVNTKVIPLEVYGRATYKGTKNGYGTYGVFSKWEDANPQGGSVFINAAPFADPYFGTIRNTWAVIQGAAYDPKTGSGIGPPATPSPESADSLMAFAKAIRAA